MGESGVSTDVTWVHRSPLSGKLYPKKPQLSLFEDLGAILPFSCYEELWLPNLKGRKLRHSKEKAGE